MGTESARRTATAQPTRRTLVLSALALVLVVLGGAAVVSLTGDAGSGTRPPRSAGEQARPASIPKPGEGTAPRRASDRGGSEQLAVLALMVGGIAVIGLVVFRGGAQARAGRRLWREAASAGHDGTVDGRGHLVGSEGADASRPPPVPPAGRP